ncbi:MAG: Gfo/Idh/MocA family oxidoreductase [Armatimonadetes bacterium]|nr:Gfo/Idh/MocA family oxidoreductase [Armatimonadota bacterium]
MIRVGIIGVGFMGVTHFKAYKRIEGAEVVALCTRNARKLTGDWEDIRGNFGEGGGVHDLTGIRKYTAIEDIVADPDIDLIDICLPTIMHRDAALTALKAGKHVILEKPIALRQEEADAMVRTAREMGRYFMVAQVLRFIPEFLFVKQAMEDGRYGSFQGGNFKRIISRPDWSTEDWFSKKERTGGPILDLHIHDSDYIRFLFGMPDRVAAAGVRTAEGQVAYLSTSYLYDNRNWGITCQSGAISMPGRTFEHGFDVYFEKGTLQYNSAWGQPLLALIEDGGQEFPQLPALDGFTGELEYAIRCMSDNRDAALLSGESARASLYLCQREIEAVFEGQPLEVQLPEL